MLPQQFVAEVYRRMELVADRGSAPVEPRTAAEFLRDQPFLAEYLDLNYRGRLPADRGAAILDIGSGQGHFIAACHSWGYSNLAAMDFGSANAAQLQRFGAKFHRVATDLPAALGAHRSAFDFIHAAHLIEHIPKHELLDNVDAMFYALRPGGALVLETPNMLARSAMVSLYVTLGHEYGFSQHNLESLLSICGFSNIRVGPVLSVRRKLKWRIRGVLEAASTWPSQFRLRLHGWRGLILSGSIIVQGIRPETDPLPQRQTAASSPS